MRRQPTIQAVPEIDPRRNRGIALEEFFSVGIVVLSGVFAAVVVNRQFGGYDLSPLVDVAWRLDQGQVPNEDFITTLPLGFLLLARLVAAVPEFSWFTFTLVNSGLVLVAQILVLAVLRVRGELDRGLRVIIGLALAIPVLYTNHLWYSTYSQVLSSVHVLWVYLYLRRQEGSPRFLFICGALLALVKQNIGPPLLLATLIVLAHRRGSGWKTSVSWLLAGFAASITGAVLLLRMSPQGLLYLILGGSSRIMPTALMWREILAVETTRITIGVLLIMAGLAAWVLSRPRAIDRPDAFAVLAFVCATLPFITDWDAKLNNATLLALTLYLIAARSSVQSDSPIGKQSASRALAGMMVVVLASLALYGGFTRERMSAVGPFFESPSTTVSSRLFENLRTGATLSGIMEELSRIGAEQTPRVFLGPRIEFAYYDLGVKSPRGLPLWWHPGTSFAESSIPAIEEAFWEADFEVVVFYDFTRFPESIRSRIEREFVLDATFAELIVYRRSEGVGARAD